MTINKQKESDTCSPSSSNNNQNATLNNKGSNKRFNTSNKKKQLLLQHKLKQKNQQRKQQKKVAVMIEKIINARSTPIYLSLKKAFVFGFFGFLNLLSTCFSNSVWILSSAWKMLNLITFSFLFWRTRTNYNKNNKVRKKKKITLEPNNDPVLRKAETLSWVENSKTISNLRLQIEKLEKKLEKLENGQSKGTISFANAGTLPIFPAPPSMTISAPPPPPILSSGPPPPPPPPPPMGCPRPFVPKTIVVSTNTKKAGGNKGGEKYGDLMDELKAAQGRLKRGGIKSTFVPKQKENIALPTFTLRSTKKVTDDFFEDEQQDIENKIPALGERRAPSKMPALSSTKELMLEMRGKKLKKTTQSRSPGGTPRRDFEVRSSNEGSLHTMISDALQKKFSETKSPHVSGSYSPGFMSGSYSPFTSPPRSIPEF